MKYILLVGGSPRELTANVNDLLKDGWELWGGVAVSKCPAPDFPEEEDTEYVSEPENGDGEEEEVEPYPLILTTYAQAMIKRD